MSKTFPGEIYNVGVTPSDLSITPNGKYAYVTNSNNYTIEGSDTVTVLDLVNKLPKLTIHDPSFVEPYRITIDSCGKYAYVCNSGSPSSSDLEGTVSIIDICKNEVVGTINGFDGPGAIVLNRKYAYVTNYGAPGGLKSGNGETISVVNLETKEIIHTIKTDLAPSGLVLSPCRKILYAICYVDGNPGTGTLNIISTKTNNIISTITGFSGPFGVDISQNGRYVYVTNFGSNNFAPYGTNVSVVDIKKGVIIKNIETGIMPAGIAVGSKFAYISNYNALYAGANYQNLTYGEGTISIICLKTNKLISPTIAVGQTPSTIILSADEKTLYVCNYVQNTVSEILL